MKIISYLGIIIFSLSLLCSPSLSLASAAPSTPSLTQKEYKQQLKQQKKQQKLEKQAAKLEKFLTKRAGPNNKKSILDRPKWVYSLIFLGVGILLVGLGVLATIGTSFALAAVTATLFTIAYYAFAISLAFFVWWIGEELNII